MHVHLSVSQWLPAPREACFALSLDASRFPDCFTGFGPIPGVRRISGGQPPAVGGIRILENSDGSVLRECVTALQPPQRHAYTLEGLRPPLAWLARSGHAEWSFEPIDGGTQVVWQYTFTLTGWPAWPVAAPLLHVFMRTAMRRCLSAMARALVAATEVAH